MGLAGLALLAYSLRQLVHASHSRRWPVVEAQILETDIEPSRRGRWYPVVRYHYQRNGHSYAGDRILFAALMVSVSRAEAERFVAQFVPGTTVHLYVSPTDDGLSVLTAGVDFRWSWPGFAAALMLIFIALSQVR
jgi:hypothetical protein